MNNPTVSIICACYNQEKFIEESLDSIKQQTFQDFEIVIWDDASKDNSVAVIERWISKNPHLKIQFVKNKTNQGICKSLNHCFELTKGKYIQILALDDKMLPWKLEQHVEILENSTERDALIFTDAYLINNESKLHQNRFIALHKVYLSIESGNFYQELLIDNFIPAMSVMLKRKVIEEIGLWDEDLVYEDYDMWLRIAKKYDFIFADKPSVEYRFHEHNSHKKLNSAMELSTFKLWLKHSDNPTIKARLHNIVLNKYFNEQDSTVIDLYFSKFRPQSFLDKLILKRRNTWIYRISKKLGG